MTDIPTLGDPDDDNDGGVIERAKRLCPWLPDPHKCDCGAYCDATVTYDPRLVEYTKAWVCPQCQSAYYRERT